MSKTVIVIFIRNPEPGRVKTRLAQAIGNEKACDLYQAMVSDILQNTRKAGFPVFLFHDGNDEPLLPLPWIRESQRVVRQEGSDLGQRMSAAFELLFCEGFERVVLTGSDVPGIDADLIRTAVNALAANDVVVAPSFDGGYSLIGISKSGFRKELFRAIEWSSPTVLESTMERCRECGISSHLLEYRMDIDTMDDLMNYAANRSAHAVHTNAWLDANIDPEKHLNHKGTKEPKQDLGVNSI